jgi:hypothetical protein
MAWMMMPAPLPNPVPGVGNFHAMLLGKFSRAAKLSDIPVFLGFM